MQQKNILFSKGYFNLKDRFIFHSELSNGGVTYWNLKLQFQKTKFKWELLFHLGLLLLTWFNFNTSMDT